MPYISPDSSSQPCLFEKDAGVPSILTYFDFLQPMDSSPFESIIILFVFLIAVDFLSIHDFGLSNNFGAFDIDSDPSSAGYKKPIHTVFSTHWQDLLLLVGRNHEEPTR